MRAFYDPDQPLLGRTMLLELRTLWVARFYVGVRVAAVYDETRTMDGRSARVFGWGYQTLEGHLESGRMDWQVWKWLDSGEVEFRIHAVSHPAHIPNPIVRLGFMLLRGHERQAFLQSTEHRMRTLTELALQQRGVEGSADRLRHASAELTAHHLPDDDDAHDKLAETVEEKSPPAD